MVVFLLKEHKYKPQKPKYQLLWNVLHMQNFQLILGQNNLYFHKKLIILFYSNFAFILKFQNHTILIAYLYQVTYFLILSYFKYLKYKIIIYML